VTGGGVCIGAIVVNAQSRESGKERDEIETAVFVAPEDILLGDVVTSPAHASLDALDMKVRIGKTYIPDVNLDTFRGGVGEQTRDSIRSEGSLEREIEALFDGSLEEAHTGVPRCAVGFGLRQLRVSGHKPSGRLIGVVVVAAELPKGGAANAALSRAVNTCENVNAWRPLGTHFCTRMAVIGRCLMSN